MSELYRRVETYAYASMFCLAEAEQWSKRRPHIWVGPDTAPYIVLESSTTKVTKNQVYIFIVVERSETTL